MTWLLIAIGGVICCAIPALLFFAAWLLSKDTKDRPPWINDDG